MNPAPKPELIFFRCTPQALDTQPPLASSLQNFESALLLIALARFPAALVSLASAIEAAFKAKLRRPEGAVDRVDYLAAETMASVPSLHVFRHSYLDFVSARNRVTHYGYSPADSEVCAELILKSGLPFIKALYQHAFLFFLDWREINPAATRFEELSEVERDRAGLVPDCARHLRLALSAYGRLRHIRGIPASRCFQTLTQYIRFTISPSFMSPTESLMLNEAGEDVVKMFEAEERIQARLSRAFKTTTALDCPECGRTGAIVAGLDERRLNTGEVSILGLGCSACGMLVTGIPPLAEEFLGDQILREKPRILEERS